MATVEELLEAEIKKKYEALLKEQNLLWSDDQYSWFRAGYVKKVLEVTPSGNQVTAYLKEHNETLKKVHAEEPIFVLRAQDKSAPLVIMHWIELNLDTVSEAKLKEAYQTALAMRRYDSRRDPT